MKSLILFLIISVFVGFGCKDTEIKFGESNEVKKAVAVLKPINGSGVSGIVYFNSKEGILELIADINGLSKGEHGFHIHQYGNLLAEDAGSTGGIYDYRKMNNELKNTKETPPGNLGNIYALNDSLAQLKKDIFSLNLTGVNSIIGRSVVVHEKEDDYSSEPCGNAGKILAAGIIGIASE